MKQIKKIVSLALVSVFVLGMTSCTNKETSSNQEGSAFNKKLKLTVWETQGTDYAPPDKIPDNVVENWLIEKTNVQIDNIYGNGGSQWDPKLTKLIAGNNLPDIVHCGAMQGPAHFAKLDKLSKVWVLTPEILQKYAPHIWERTPKEYWDRMTVDGKILGIPYYSFASKEISPNLSDEDLAFIKQYKETQNTDVTYAASHTLWIRDDIVKKYYPSAKTYDELVALMKERNEPIGDELLDIPIKTTKEFIDFMYKIRKENMKENDKTVYAFGYDGGDNWSALSWLGADMYGYKGHNYTATWNDKKQKIEVPLVKDLIKNVMKTQTQMIVDDVIDPESLAHTAALYKEKVMNGQYAIIPMSLMGATAQEVNTQLKQAGKAFQFRPFITQVTPMEEYQPYKEERLWGESLCILKTLKEDELYQVLNWIDVQFTDEYEDVLNWGSKSAGLYTEEASGKRKFNDDKFNDYFINGNATALQASESKGLGGIKLNTVGLFSVRASYYSRWTPDVLLKKVSLRPESSSGFKFKSTSEHVKNVKTYPPCQIWSSVYAEIPEVVTFWSEREQWESKFKMILTTQSGEAFEEKWNAAVKAVNEIVDISSIEDKMTDIAKTFLKE